MAPGMTDYRKRIQYQTYDVTGLLQDKNTLELRLADGWYRGSSAAYGATNVYGSQTSLIAQLEIDYRDGTHQVIATDQTFAWSNDGSIRFADLKDGEVFVLEKNPSIREKQLRSRILPKTSRIYRHLVMWQYVKKRLFTPNF